MYIIYICGNTLHFRFNSFMLLLIIVLLLSYFFTNSSKVFIFLFFFYFFNTTIIDINECEDEKNNTCKSNEKCVNVPGSFHCVCMEGYHLDTEACVADQPARKSSLAINLAVGEYNYYIALSCTSNVTFSYSVANHTKKIFMSVNSHFYCRNMDYY